MPVRSVADASVDGAESAHEMLAVLIEIATFTAIS